MAISIKACLVPNKDNKAVNLGMRYCYEHKSKWVDISQFKDTLTVGYVKGVDHVIYKGVCYMIWKGFFDVAENTYVLLCIESTSGCDIIDNLPVVEPETPPDETPEPETPPVVEPEQVVETPTEETPEPETIP